jgi:hypothetical protein
VPVACLVAVLFPPLHVGICHLLRESGKIVIVLRPQHRMPVVGHQAVATDSHRPRAKRFIDDPLQGQVVVSLLEQRPSAHASIEYVEHHSTRRFSCWTTQALIVTLRNASSELIRARRASEGCAAALGNSLACASGSYRKLTTKADDPVLTSYPIGSI